MIIPTIHLFLDESGDFGEALSTVAPGQSGRASLVGGVCGFDSSASWDALHRACVKKFDDKHGVHFHYPKDFHCGKLLAGDTPSKAVPIEQRVEFATAVFQEIATSGQGLFRVISRNDPSIFAYSRQATYGLNLVAALRATLDELARREEADAGFRVGRLHVVIAQRTIGETVPNEGKSTGPGNLPYHMDLADFLQAQLPFGTGPEAKLARRLADTRNWQVHFTTAHSDAGLMSADFVCNRHWNDKTLDRGAVATRPDKEIFGNYEEACNRGLRRLLDAGQYATAAHFRWRNFPSQPGGGVGFAPVLKRMESERDANVLARELAALLGFDRYLIERRTAEPGALAAAREILDALAGLARQTLHRVGEVDAMVRREWAGLLVDALSELLACVNHQGATVGQAAIQSELDEALDLYAGLLPRTYAQRQELRLEARNRNLNRLFNDYGFSEIIRDFEAEVTRREESFPAGTTDELLGKMQGSFGQACAFQARVEDFYAEPARESLERSMAHFQPGTYFHSVSVNYLATLTWQSGDLDAACRWMNAHAPRLLPIAGSGKLAARLHEYVSQPDANAFDIVNYLRLAALGAEKNVRPGAEVLRAVAACVEPRFHAEHPHEQVAKWLAYLFHLAGDHAEAARLCRRGAEICRPLDFTVHTIGLSIVGLEAVCQHAGGDQPADGSAMAAFQAERARLVAASVRFQQYLTQVGDLPDLAREIETGAPDVAARIVRLPPFTYA